MEENKTNIFDLVEEVNKNKKKSSMEVENEINDIYSMLDDIKTDNNISVDDVREKINNYQSSKAKINDSLQSYSTTVKVPSLPNYDFNYETYSECILKYIQGVDYGNDNSKEYVEGHRSALEKYFNEIKNNRKDIYVVEAHVNEEINNIESKERLFDKGYYDGLFYVLRAIKKSKEKLTNTLSDKLRVKLG